MPEEHINSYSQTYVYRSERPEVAEEDEMSPERNKMVKPSDDDDNIGYSVEVGYDVFSADSDDSDGQRQRPRKDDPDRNDREDEDDEEEDGDDEEGEEDEEDDDPDNEKDQDTDQRDTKKKISRDEL